MFPNSFSVTYLQARGRRHGSSVLHAFLADVTRWPAEDGPDPHGSSRWPPQYPLQRSREPPKVTFEDGVFCRPPPRADTPRRRPSGARGRRLLVTCFRQHSQEIRRHMVHQSVEPSVWRGPEFQRLTSPRRRPPIASSWTCRRRTSSGATGRRCSDPSAACPRPSRGRERSLPARHQSCPRRRRDYYS